MTPIELSEARKGDMSDVEVQSHADSVGRHQIVDLAGLVQRHLGVARARAERAHHHGCAAFLAAYQFGEGIDALDGKPDDSGTRGHPADFLRAGIGQLGKPVAPQKLSFRHQRGNRRPHGVRAEKKRLVLAARVQKPIGKDVSALGVGTKLNLIDGQEIGAHALRHRLGRADPVSRARRNNSFLASDKRNNRWPAKFDNPVVDLARKQPKRQTNDPGAVRQHALDGVMRLAGVCGAKNRGHKTERLRHCRVSNSFCWMR